MKTLPITRKHDGFELKQLLRNGNFALFEQRKPGTDHVAFEVIRIQTHDAARISNGDGTFREVEAGESYPSSERWGTDGFTFGRFEMAYKKYRELIQKEQERQAILASTNPSQGASDAIRG